MRGDGTENNPFIPETLTEFIQAVGNFREDGERPYVELNKDILANEDPNYTGELSSPITILAVNLNGNGHCIKGVTIKASNILYFDTNLSPSIAQAYIHDISFLNFFHKRINDRTSISTSSISSVKFKNCFFSIRSESIADVPCNRFCYGIIFERCGINFRSDRRRPSYPRNGVLVSSTFNQCTVIIDNINPIIHYTGEFVITDVTSYQTVFIFKNMAAGFYAGAFMYGNHTYGYVVVELTSADKEGSLSVPSGTQFYSCLINKTDKGITLGGTSITLEQLKDKDYLIDIGWLP